MAAGETVEKVRALGVSYPRDVFSLSHVALPFPADDPLYGSQPNGQENFGVALGSFGGSWRSRRADRQSRHAGAALLGIRSFRTCSRASSEAIGPATVH